jgi:hypothetical protein
MGMSAEHYSFRSQWRISADPDEVYAALADVATYPAWWPEVLEARMLDDGASELRCRGMLPYDLVFAARREIEDPERRILQASLSGDITGTSQWTITGADGASSAVFDEDLVVARALIRLVGPLGRPALRFNHDRMMRAGERGLRRHLARRDVKD